MSYRALFAPLVSRLMRKDWGEHHEFVQELAAALTSSSPIDLYEPIVLNNRTDTAGVWVNNLGNRQERGLVITDADGRQATLGIGLGSEGIVANELVALPQYVLDPSLIFQKYATAGGGGGTTLTPGSSANIAGVPTGPGVVRNNQVGQDVGSGYGQGVSGSGTPGVFRGDIDQFIPVPGAAETLLSIQDQLTSAVPDGTAYRYTLNGTEIYILRDLGRIGLIRGTVASIGADTITVTKTADSQTVTVAKPLELRSTNSVNDGWTPSGSDAQNRTKSGYAAQAVEPLYVSGDEIYIAYPGSTGVSSVSWLDANVDARHWCPCATVTTTTTTTTTTAVSSSTTTTTITSSSTSTMAP